MTRNKVTQGNALVKSQDPIVEFFAKYPNFAYDPHCETWSEYRRLVDFSGWKTFGKRERAANKLLREAIVAQFGRLYGTSENKLDTLQHLCDKLGINPVPQSITACKKAIQKTHVNIMDFIDSERTGKPVRVFKSVWQLRKHTLENQKVFPRKEAKESGLLKYLLRRIVD
ncbi:hypothetical protein QQS21_012746 [Conoideocrella luteorostrata]|uniref:Uncharacterized protein n=1 Tax=Conoideocrella luteorostrata TaxID=1105319 RepID=A0AAJ0CBR2_9HYPO|nr:hypothetical protein QQS21_012746 [Conoideocrella luteorostrata]